MKKRKLGNTDIEVSPICVGCMSFGTPGTMHQWSLDYEDSEKIIRHTLDLGLNFYDTANSYSKGTSEEFLGRAIKNNIAREKVVIASKVYFNPGRLSKQAINREIEGTLKRLGTNYLDLYIIHRFDYDTPIEETMETLNDLVKSGKVRALGASAMYGYQFNKMQQIAKDNGWAQFQTLENHYNLLYREDERELIPVAKEWGASLMPYSPLAGGHLAHSDWTTNSLRSKTDKVLKGKYDKMEASDIKIVERVHELSEKYNLPMSQIATSWLFKKGVTSPIIGATKKEHYDDAVASINVNLSDEDVDYLEELYVPHPIVGAIKQNPVEGTILLDEKK